MKEENNRVIGIRDIASFANVSTATVSRVINQPESTSPEIRKKVEEVIKKYNYVPNQMARNLFSKKSNSIALFVYDLSNPFFISLVRELNNITFDNNYTLLICDTENDEEKEEKYLRYCQSIRCTGSILTEGANYNLFIDTKFSQKIACLDRRIEKYSYVTSDNYGGVQQLVDYLYNLNHRKIAYAEPMVVYQSGVRRKQGYIDRLKLHGINTREDYIFRYGKFSGETGVRALDYFLSISDPPTAIICANDQIAQGLIMRANKLGISIPNDISIVGYDGVDPSHFFPKITTIKQDVRKIASTLFDSIKDQNAPLVNKIIDNKMVIGESCRKIPLLEQ